MRIRDERPPPQGRFGVLFRHKKKAVCVFVLTMALVIGGLIWAPRSFRSEAMLFVRVGRESIGVDPTVTTQAMLSLNESRESEINSVLEMLSSRAVAEQVVDRIGPERLLANRVVEAPDWIMHMRAMLREWLPPLPTSAAISDRERAVNAVIKKMKIWAPKRSHVITVRAHASSPELAQQIVATVLEVYEGEHLRLNRTPGSHKFVVQQAALTHEQLRRASAELADAKNDVGVVSVEGQRRILEDRIARTKTEIARATTAMAANEAKSSTLRTQIEETPQQLVAEQTSGLPNAALDAMRTELYKLEIYERELLSKYNEDDPLVRNVRRQKQESREILGDEESERTQVRTTVNPLKQQLELSLAVEQATSASLRAELGSLTAESETLFKQLATLNRREVRIADLQRHVELLDASYRDYATKRELTRFDDALEEHRISNVNVAQAPTFVQQPVSPEPRLILPLGLFVALIGAVGMALLAEDLDRSRKSAGDVERASGLQSRREAPGVPALAADECAGVNGHSGVQCEPGKALVGNAAGDSEH